MVGSHPKYKLQLSPKQYFQLNVRIAYLSWHNQILKYKHANSMRVTTISGCVYIFLFKKNHILCIYSNNFEVKRLKPRFMNFIFK